MIDRVKKDLQLPSQHAKYKGTGYGTSRRPISMCVLVFHSDTTRSCENP